MSAVCEDQANSGRVTLSPPITLDPPPLRFSPADGSFIRMLKENGKPDPNGYVPPQGMFCEFSTVRNPTAFMRGITAQLLAMGPWKKTETVFVCTIEGGEFVYFMRDIAMWRQMADVTQFTSGQMTYLTGSNPVFQPGD